MLLDKNLHHRVVFLDRRLKPLLTDGLTLGAQAQPIQFLSLSFRLDYHSVRSRARAVKNSDQIAKQLATTMPGAGEDKKQYSKARPGRCQLNLQVRRARASLMGTLVIRGSLTPAPGHRPAIEVQIHLLQ